MNPSLPAEVNSADVSGLTLPSSQLDHEILGDYLAALDREWLVTNGIGGYASASLGGANTRRYHGLLVAALQPPLARTVLLGKLDEEVWLVGDQIYELAVNEWGGGAVSQAGLGYLERFEQQGNGVTFYYRLGAAAMLTKTVWMEYGLNTTYVRYTYQASHNGDELELRVRPLLNYRDYHANTRGANDWQFKIEPTTESVPAWRITAQPDATPWHLIALDGSVEWQAEVGNGWYWNFYYRQEAARGLNTNEDMYCAGTFVSRLKPGQSVTFAASTGPVAEVVRLYGGSRERETRRQIALLATAGITQTQDGLSRLAARLVLAADQFIVGRPDPARPGQLLPDYRTILAGYHWFADWGRDTMIALPGLTMATGRYGEAATILRTFARFVSQGMLPNRFPDNAEAPAESEYNTVDATLWYFDAIDKYLAATNDTTLGQELYPVLDDIVGWHLRGTRFGIKVDRDGLLSSGVDGVQLTWMDAKIGDWVVTPRRGKPIEINALWYRACRIMEKLSRQYSTVDRVEFYAALAARIAAIFEQTYWYEEGGYFYDLINEFGQPDPALRPNQAIALGVAPSLFSQAKARSALARVRQDLLTPYGLRSLSPHDPAYRPTYGGDQFQRDSAYHEGTIWPWLIGPFARALLDREGPTALQLLLEGFNGHLTSEAGIGQVNEIFGAEPPFPPVGCIAQAWSVSQLLEIWQLLPPA